MNIALGAGATAASWWLVSPHFALSLGFGTLLEAVNFRGLQQQSQLLFWGEIKSGGGWTGLYAMRFGLLVIGIGGGLGYFADDHFDTSPIYLILGTLIGFGAFVRRLFRLGRQLQALDAAESNRKPESSHS